MELTTFPAVSTVSNVTPGNHPSIPNIPTIGSVRLVKGTTLVDVSRVSSAVNLNLGLYRLVGLADRNLEMDLGIVIGMWNVVMETMKVVEYGVIGEGSQILNNQKRENSAYSILIGRNL